MKGLGFLNAVKYRLAADEFTTAIRLDPIGGYYSTRGDAYHKMGQYAYAIQDYEEYIRQYPDHGTGYSGRGAAYSKLGRYHSAIKDFNKAIEVNLDDSGSYTNRGITYFLLGQYSKADADLAEACSLVGRWKGPLGEEARRQYC